MAVLLVLFCFVLRQNLCSLGLLGTPDLPVWNFPTVMAKHSLLEVRGTCSSADRTHSKLSSSQQPFLFTVWALVFPVVLISGAAPHLAIVPALQCRRPPLGLVSTRRAAPLAPGLKATWTTHLLLQAIQSFFPPHPPPPRFSFLFPTLPLWLAFPLKWPANSTDSVGSCQKGSGDNPTPGRQKGLLIILESWEGQGKRPFYGLLRKACHLGL